MAVAMRVLLHHSPPQSKSVLEQAGLAGTEMISSAPEVDWRPGVFHSTLAGLGAGPNGMEARPKLGAGPDRRLLSLQDWLGEIVIQDTRGHQFSRWYIIRSVANQDGGAHVDSELDEAYHRLVNEHTWGLTSIGPNGPQVVGGVERVFIRQMAWEVLESLRGKVDGIGPPPEPPANLMTGMSSGPLGPSNPPRT